MRPVRLIAESLRAPTVCLRPSRVADAEELAPLLADVALYQFIGGSPPTLSEVRAQLQRQADGPPPHRREVWLNWIVRAVDDQRAMGTVQATVRGTPRGGVAELAWIIATGDQGRGVAKASAALVARWLGQHGITCLCAHIHPQHHASQAVAASLGLQPTEEIIDGERRWARNQ